ncbi:MAG TPA: hypothetical protein VF188_03855 [Longimicrobiales bacterium]
MNALRATAALAWLCIGLSSAAWGQTITVSADPAPLVVATALAGAEPDPVTDATTTYDVAVGAATARIVARLGTALPPGVALELELEAPPGATSVGPVALTLLDQDVVVGIPAGTNASGLAISYTLSATAQAGVIGPQTPTVLLTVTSP